MLWLSFIRRRTSWCFLNIRNSFDESICSFVYSGGHKCKSLAIQSSSRIYFLLCHSYVHLTDSVFFSFFDKLNKQAINSCNCSTLHAIPQWKMLIFVHLLFSCWWSRCCVFCCCRCYITYPQIPFWMPPILKRLCEIRSSHFQDSQTKTDSCNVACECAWLW